MPTTNYLENIVIIHDFYALFFISGGNILTCSLPYIIRSSHALSAVNDLIDVLKEFKCLT